jgi:hypothetical protein
MQYDRVRIEELGACPQAGRAVSFLVPSRVDQQEHLDEHDAPRDEMERSLRDLRRFNRYLGGIRIYRKLLRGAASENSSILDIGTGTSDLLMSVDGSSRLRIGLDFKIQHLLYGRRLDGIRPGADPLRRVLGDGFHLPFRSGSLELVTSAHFFHHFSPEENVVMLRECLRVARRAVLVNDTRRNLIPLLTVRALSILRLVGSITRFDAPASVLRGYTLAEARDIARQAGARRFEVVRLLPFRFGILLWK